MGEIQEKIDKLIVDKLKVKPSISVYKQIFSQNMELFGKYYFSDKLYSPNSMLHRWLYEKAVLILNKPLGKGIKLGVAAPRGHAKSTLISFVLPLWCACFARKRFVVLLSETQGQADDFLGDIKNELAHGDLINRHFPNVAGLNKERWRQDDIITKNDIRIMSLGCGGKMRGRTHRKIRPDLFVLDDVESRDSVETEHTRRKLRHQWFDKELLKAGATDGTSDYLFVGTILHEDSLLNNVLDRKEYPDWLRKKFKAVIKFSARSDLWDHWHQIFMTHEDEEKAAEVAFNFFKENEEAMLAGTKVLWPEMESYYDLMCMTLTPDSYSAFLSEKQNQPIDLSRVLVTKSDLHTFHFDIVNRRIIVPDFKVVDFADLTFFGAWDPSKGKKAGRGDFSAVVTIAKDPDGIIYVIDFDLKRRPVERRMYDILELHKRYNYRMFAVETAAFQYFVKDTLQAKSREKGVYIPLREDKGLTDKILRIEGLIPYVMDGTIRFRHASERTAEYNEGINQLVGFNAGAKYDDAPDALAMAFDVVKKGVFVRKALVDGETVRLGR